MYLFLWIFFLYAFLGWCTEVSFAALVSGRFVNRGFLNGPVCPIYGFGVVIVLACLTPLKSNFLLLFLGSVSLTSLLELVTGFALEKIFHQRWWDYSNEPFNLGGYICLRFSIAWGLACLFVVDILHPSILFLICLVPHTLGWVLLAIFGAAMAVDLAATVRIIAKINRRLCQIDELAAKIKDASNEFGETLADKVLEAAEKGSDLKEDLDDLAEELALRRAEFQEDLNEFRDNLDEIKDDLLQRHAVRQFQKEQYKASVKDQLQEWHNSLQDLMDGDTFGQRRLLNAFPQMRSIDHKQALEHLRRCIEQRRISPKK